MKAVSMKELLGKILSSPFIVEQGTSGIWTYRKWSDGTAECWGIGTSASTHYATVFGGYGYTAQFALPSSLFNATPIVTYSCHGGGSFNLTGTQTSSSTSTVAVYSVSNTSGSKSISWRMHVIGKWK